MNRYEVIDSATGEVLYAYEDTAQREAELPEGREIRVTDISFEYAMRACLQQRQAAYEAEMPLGAQLDADSKARAGNPSEQQAMDAKRAEIKARIPKPVQPA